MRMPRFRVRTLMIVVAVLALPLGLCMERRSRFLRLAAEHAREAYRGGSALPMIFDNSGPEPRYCDDSGRELSASEAEQRIALNSWHDSLALKYRRAAASPWLPVEPDPPEPR
jgi:hypothetical protein